MVTCQAGREPCADPPVALIVWKAVESLKPMRELACAGHADGMERLALEYGFPANVYRALPKPPARGPTLSVTATSAGPAWSLDCACGRVVARGMTVWGRGTIACPGCKARWQVDPRARSVIRVPA